MNISIEIPVIRGGWLIQCIDSVLQQTSSNWFLTMYWDCGDQHSKDLLRQVAELGHPRIQVLFGEKSLGIARARAFLTSVSRGDFILPLDDDDVLQPDAVRLMLLTATERPWASIIRARRGFIDDMGEPVLMTDWFKFERRKYFNGATCDITNHSHPYAIRRSAFLSKGGWTGFKDFAFVGEDCSCFTQSEEVGEIELLDELLYDYRIHQSRTSLKYTPPDAYEMWRRIADESVIRRKAPVKRISDIPPFDYIADFKTPPDLKEIDFIIPFWETNEREIGYASSRPVSHSSFFLLRADTLFHQKFTSSQVMVSRIEVAFTAIEPAQGTVSVAFFNGSRFSAMRVLSAEISSLQPVEFEMIKFDCRDEPVDLANITDIEISFRPKFNSASKEIILHVIKENGTAGALLRLFALAPGFCRRNLKKGISSLRDAGIKERQIHIIEERASSSANRNTGFRKCSKEWICLMDDDVRIPGADTLHTLLKVMVDLQAGLSGPKLLTPSGRIYSGAPFIDPLTLSTKVAGMGEEDQGQFDFNALVPWLPSTLMMVHHSVVLSTGGFDESFIGSQHEDADFCLRARARGFKCCYAGKTSAIHDNMLRNGNFSVNMRYLRERWKSRHDLFVWPDQ